MPTAYGIPALSYTVLASSVRSAPSAKQCYQRANGVKWFDSSPSVYMCAVCMHAGGCAHFV